MAVIYLRSTDGNDADDGSTWALAKATLAAALTAAGAGGTVYVSQNHAESAAATMTLTSPGTAAAPVKVVCVNDSAMPPTTAATTAIVTTSAGAIAFHGFTYSYGVTYKTTGFNIQMNFLSTNPWWWRLEKGALLQQGNHGGADINIGGLSTGDDQLLELIDCNVQFNHASGSFNINNAAVRWFGGRLLTAIMPDYLFSPTGAGYSSLVEVSGVDLSALGSGKSLVLVSAPPHRFKFNNCKLGPSVSAISSTISGQGATQVYIDNCDSADTNYRMEHYKYQGSIKSETSKIRSGGASDGTTPLSWNMTSLAGASFVSPLESPQFVIWNDTTGSAKTVTVEIAQDSAATALTDDECWLEVEYLGTAGYPLSVITSDRKTDIMASAANQTTSTATWSNMTTPTKQKLEVTFTPQEKGFFQCRVMLAKPSVTVYVDPLATVS